MNQLSAGPVLPIEGSPVACHGHASSPSAVWLGTRVSWRLSVYLGMGIACLPLATLRAAVVRTRQASPSAQLSQVSPSTQPSAAFGEAAHAADSDLRAGRVLLQTRQFAAARRFFAAYLQKHPGDVQAQLGLGDALLALHDYEAAEARYRAVVARQPELWQAHKNLVIAEAALGRWEEFDGERRVLQLARERGAPGISPHESDVIDSFDVRGQHWVVRAYFEPLGRSQAIYNFERFSPTGRVEAYVSLENAAAAQAALHPGDVRIGPSSAVGKPGATETALALNWYTGSAHGTLQQYPHGDPGYPRLRAEVLRWLHTHDGPK